MKGNKKSENGITLVALIITIIVLIILSAITIKTVTDMKIIQFAIKGTEDYSKAQDKEIEDFKQIENLLTDTISNIQSDNGGSDLESPAPPEELIVLTQEDIGKYINYVPIGTEYTVEAKYSGCTENQIFSQDTNLKWQIWKVENDTLYLISEGLPSTSGYNNDGNLLLKGAQGYNNGIALLDNLCQANYGINENANVKVQNLKIEDILAVKADHVENKDKDIYGTQPYICPSSGTFAFPNIWYNKERESLEIATSSRSTAYPFVEEVNKTVSASSQKPYYISWNLDINKIEYWKNKQYCSILMDPAKTKAYLLSSHIIRPAYENYFGFGLQDVNRTYIAGSTLYSWNNGKTSEGEINSGIRPLVSIPLKNCEITKNEIAENTFDIIIK